MMKLLKYTQKFALLIILLFASQLYGQRSFGQETTSDQYYYTPFDFTNRPLGYLSDASAVAWNPALLGIRGTADLLIGAPITNDFKIKDDQFSVFAKSNAFGVGFIMDKHPLNKDTNIFTKSIIVGLGYPIRQHSLWWGASAMYRGTFDGNYGVKSFRYKTSLIYSPFAALITSVGVSNMFDEFNFNNWYFSGSYSPLEWLSLHVNLVYSPQGRFRDNSKFSKNFYISFGGLKDYLIASLGYRDIDKSIRLGLEFNWQSISVGTIPKFSEGNYAGANTFIRLTNEKFHNSAEFANRYTISTSFFNAEISNKNGTLWNPSNNNATPERVMDILFASNENNKAIYNSIMEGSSKQDAFKYISNKYYTADSTQIEQVTDADTSYITTPWHYNIKVQSVRDEGEEKVVRFKVSDAFARSMPNLERKDFSSVNERMIITSFEEVPAEPQEKYDIIILQDCSNTLKDQINNISLNLPNFFRLLNQKGIDLRVGGVWYGEQIYKITEPTKDVEKFIKEYKNAPTNAPDEVTSIAINEALKTEFRKDANRIFILISDEPAFQTNTSITETELIQKLWKSRIHLYSVADYSKFNSGLLTKLTLGREYQICDDINSTMIKIANEILTNYEIRMKDRGY